MATRFDHFDFPLFDPEAIDPNNEHIEEMMEMIATDNYNIGLVCGVYELCGHLLCAKSYELWEAWQRTKEALHQWEQNGRQATQPHDHEFVSMENELIDGGYFCRICGKLVDKNVNKEFVVND